MFAFILKYKLNASVVVFTLIVVAYFISQQICVSQTRDSVSNRIAKIEQTCAKYKERIKSSQAEKERYCNAEVLRDNATLRDKMREPEKIIRVRTSQTMFNNEAGKTANAATRPKDLAAELFELSALSMR